MLSNWTLGVVRPRGAPAAVFVHVGNPGRSVNVRSSVTSLWAVSAVLMPLSAGAVPDGGL